MSLLVRRIATAVAALSLVACQSLNRPPLRVVDYVDLKRFMGDWYVIASIPTFIESDAYNAVETYTLNSDGTIATTFVFNEGGFDGKPKRYNPKGFVVDEESNAVWGMQFIWPIKADYRVMYLDDAYSTTIIGRERRDYVWIMARNPQIPAQRYQELLTLLAEQGYDIGELREVPHANAQTQTTAPVSS